MHSEHVNRVKGARFRCLSVEERCDNKLAEQWRTEHNKDDIFGENAT